MPPFIKQNCQWPDTLSPPGGGRATAGSKVQSTQLLSCRTRMLVSTRCPHLGPLTPQYPCSVLQTSSEATGGPALCPFKHLPPRESQPQASHAQSHGMPGQRLSFALTSLGLSKENAKPQPGSSSISASPSASMTALEGSCPSSPQGPLQSRGVWPQLPSYTPSNATPETPKMSVGEYF